MKYAALLLLVGCADKSDADYRAEVVASMHDSITGDLDELAAAARDLQAAAPTHVWTDADVPPMIDAWRRARIAYEHVEGATAPIFPDLDLSLDARYDDFLANQGPDDNLFDGTGVTGMHAIERILFAPQIRASVITFESTLPGYQPARYPMTDDEAQAFRTELVQKFVDDADSLKAQWKPAAIDIGAAYQGLVGLMNEQKEKVNLAATGEEESRYANWTLFDLRNNLDGTTKIYALFRPWIAAKHGAAHDTAITTVLGDITSLYAATPGDALPPVPTDWSSDNPTAADLATPFGMLWQQIHQAVDPTRDGSAVHEMNAVAVLLGFPEFVQ
jgi:iron uptake system component EfeO